MKIVAAIGSRGRPRNLSAVLTAFYRLRSGENEIEFLVGLDEDDPESMAAVQPLVGDFSSATVEIYPGPADMMIGDKFDRLYRLADPDGAFVLVTDRMFPLTQGWDMAVSSAIEQHPDRVLWWQCAFYKGAAAPVISSQCRRLHPRMFSGLFPFWFEDNWLEEVDLLMHGFPRIRLSAEYGGERFGKTNGFREYLFWIEVFVKTRPRRIALAREACRRMGQTWQERPEVMAWFANRDESWRASAAEIEESNRTGQPPSARYSAAKRQAERIIEEEQTA